MNFTANFHVPRRAHCLGTCQCSVPAPTVVAGTDCECPGPVVVHTRAGPDDGAAGHGYPAGLSAHWTRPLRPQKPGQVASERVLPKLSSETTIAQGDPAKLTAPERE